MDKQFDELSKSLAAGVSRREALRKFGLGLAEVFAASLGLAASSRSEEQVRQGDWNEASNKSVGTKSQGHRCHCSEPYYGCNSAHCIAYCSVYCSPY